MDAITRSSVSSDHCSLLPEGRSAKRPWNPLVAVLRSLPLSWACPTSVFGEKQQPD